MRPEREHEGGTLFIDPATRASLELARTMSGNRDGSLPKAIDRTVTGGGARLLAERLTAPLTSPKEIALRLDFRFVVPERGRRCARLCGWNRRACPICRAPCRGWPSGVAARAIWGALACGFEAAGGIALALDGALLPDETSGGARGH
ncbi:hypothetical protein VXQ18_00500 [Brucella abortus]|nr:hypothetical protein [Brucella abortus]